MLLYALSGLFKNLHAMATIHQIHPLLVLQIVELVLDHVFLHVDQEFALLLLRNLAESSLEILRVHSWLLQQQAIVGQRLLLIFYLCLLVYSL